MTDAEVQRFIRESSWQFAKSMPRDPHEYTMKKWLSPEDRKTFEAFVLHIRAEGQWRIWGKLHLHAYLVVGEWCYWTMGATLAETILINRQHKSEVKGLDRPLSWN